MKNQPTVDDVLSHIGIKGMKWGVRKESKLPPSDDSVRVSEIHQKVNVGGTRVLSNKELQDFITRTNLELQFNRLDPSIGKKASRFVSEMLQQFGKQQATKFAANVLTKQVGNLFK